MPIAFTEDVYDSTGKFLKALRKEKGYTLRDVSQETKIKERFLEAIENDNLTDHIDRSYAKIHIINYARFLGANVDQVLDMFLTKHNLMPSPKQAKTEKDENYKRKILVSKNVLKVIMLIFFLIALYSLGSILYKKGNLQRNIFKMSNSDEPMDSALVQAALSDSEKIESDREPADLTSPQKSVFRTKEVYREFFLKDESNPWYVSPEYIKRKS